MRKFNSPVNLKAAADSFVSEAFIDVTLTELVSAHSIARPLLALHFRLKKWCDLVNGFVLNVHGVFQVKDYKVLHKL